MIKSINGNNASGFLRSMQWVAVGLLSVGILIPVLMVILRSFTLDGSWQWSAPFQVIRDSSLLQVYLNSLYLGILVIAGTTVLALPMAYLMAKTEFKKHQWLNTVLMVPFMTPPYIASMGWILFMQERGFLDQFAPRLSFFRNFFFSPGGIAMIMAFHLFPFLYLILRNAMTKIGSSLEDAGAVHGGTFFYRMKRIMLPLLVAPLGIGWLLIFVKTISEFGTPATLGRRIGFRVLTTEIYQYTSNWPIDFGRAAAISSVLLATCMVIWYFQNWMNDRNTWQTLGSKSKETKVYSLGKWKILAWIYVAGVLILSIGIPYFSIITTSLMDLRGYGVRLDNFTLRHFVEVLRIGSQGYRGIVTSVQLALFAATLSMILGSFYAIIVVKSKGRIKKLIDSSSLISNTIPSVVVIVGLIFFWNHGRMPIPLYNTPLMLGVAYTVLFIPFTVQYVKSSLQQIDDSLFQAARVSGASKVLLFQKIMLPLIWPGMIAGWIMTFIISTRELIASLMIRPPGMVTTATYIYGQFEQGNASQGMAMALLTVLITVSVMLLVQRFLKGGLENG